MRKPEGRVFLETTLWGVLVCIVGIGFLYLARDTNGEMDKWVRATAETLADPLVAQETLNGLPAALINNSFKVEKVIGNGIYDVATAFAYRADEDWVFFASAGHVTRDLQSTQPVIVLTQPHLHDGMAVVARINPERAINAPDRDLGILALPAGLFPEEYAPLVAIAENYTAQQHCVSLGVAAAASDGGPGWHAWGPVNIDWTQQTTEAPLLEVKTTTDQQLAGGDSGSAVFCGDQFSGIQVGANPWGHLIVHAPITNGDIADLESQLK